MSVYKFEGDPEDFLEALRKALYEAGAKIGPVPPPSPNIVKKPARPAKKQQVDLPTAPPPQNPYKTAHDEVWANLPKWKQLAIEEDRKAGNFKSTVMTDYTGAVNRRAEEIYNAANKS